MLIANLLGIITLFFLLWNTLKDDYLYEKIFNLGFSILIGGVIGYLISLKILSNYWFWIIILFSVSGYFISIIKQKIKFFESFDGLVISLMFWTSYISFYDSIKMSSLSSFLAFWLSLICVFAYYFTLSHYRTFSWYKSGRIGFSGVTTCILYFLFRIIESFVFPNTIFLARPFDIYISISSSLLLLVLLYNLFKKVN